MKKKKGKVVVGSTADGSFQPMSGKRWGKQVDASGDGGPTLVNLVAFLSPFQRFSLWPSLDVWKIASTRRHQRDWPTPHFRSWSRSVGSFRVGVDSAIELLPRERFFYPKSAAAVVPIEEKEKKKKWEEFNKERESPRESLSWPYMVIDVSSFFSLSRFSCLCEFVWWGGCWETGRLNLL